MDEDEIESPLMDHTEAEPPAEPEPTPFMLMISYRNGRQTELEVTSFEATRFGGRITDAAWTQLTAVPGDFLLQYVDWTEVQEVVTYTRRER